MKLVPASLGGVALIELDTFEDERGSFREAYQQEKLRELGLKTPAAVQMNVAESKRNVIRGIHFEPWDKYIHVTAGEVFAAIVDGRTDSPTFGKTETFTLDSTKALFVPEGLGNSYAVVSAEATYTYLVPKHWNPEVTYPAVSLADQTLQINWPILEADRIISDKDRQNPPFAEVFHG